MIHPTRTLGKCRRRLSLAVLCSFALPLPAALAQTPTAGAPLVWRDDQGVAHIEAVSEADAYYAMGYEEARDALFHIQANLMTYNGQARKYLGPGNPVLFPAFADLGAHAFNDFVVKTYDTSYESKSQAEVLALLTSQLYGTGIPPSQMYENLCAYAAGIEEYRVRLQAGTGLNPQEQVVRDWILNERQDPWVLSTPVTVGRIASFGGWLKGGPSLATALLNMQQVAASPCFLATGASAEPPTGDEEDLAAQMVAGLFPTGSNGFAWSSEAATAIGSPSAYVEEDGVRYSGVVADPQSGRNTTWQYKQGSPQTGFDGGSRATVFNVHTWHVQLKVPSTGLNVFGKLFHGAGCFFTWHNDDLGIGGSSVASNLADAVMLRLETDGTGLTTDPAYYDYYGSDFRALPSKETATIETDTSGGTVSVDYWHLDHFGLVFCDQPVLVNYTDIAPGINSFDPNFDYQFLPYQGTVPPGFTPVLLAARAPADSKVDASTHHRRFAVGQYRLLRAETVEEFRDALNDLEGTYITGVVCADRAGGVFSTYAAPIPERADDATLTDPTKSILGLPQNVGNYPLAKQDLYDKYGDGLPVPACFQSDRAFDFRFDTAPTTSFSGGPASSTIGTVRYLKTFDPADPAFQNGPAGQPFLPFSLYVPGGASYPPVQAPQGVALPSGGAEVLYDNPGFATISNDLVQHAYKRRAKQGATTLSASDDRLLQDIIDSGVFYYSMLQTFVGLEKTQNIIQRLLDIQTGDPAMDIDDARQFALDDRLLMAKDYPGYISEIDGTTVAPDPELSTYATPIRILGEIEATITPTPADDDRDTLALARQEANFFIDFYRALIGWAPNDWQQWTSSDNTAINLREMFLRSLPVGPSGGAGAFFFDTSTGGGLPPIAFDMPERYPLYDFFPAEIRLAGDRLLGDSCVANPASCALELMSPAELSVLHTLFDFTGEWPLDELAQDQLELDASATVAQQPAALAMYLKSFEAREAMQPGGNVNLGLTWVPLRRNDAGDPTVLRMPVGSDPFLSPIEGILSASTEVVLPASTITLAQEPDKGPDNARLLRFGGSYQPFLGIAEPRDAWASAMGKVDRGSYVVENNPLVGDGVPFGTPIVPLDALYSDIAARTIRPASQLTEDHVNALTAFLLQLGDFTIPTAANQYSTSKFAKVQTAWQESGINQEPWPDTYPLSRNLVRIALVKRFVQARNHLQGTPYQNWGDLTNTRFFDFRGGTLFDSDTDLPLSGGQAPGVTGNAIRAIGWASLSGAPTPADLEAAAAAGAFSTGFSDRLLGVGGGYTSMLVLFPDVPNLPPRSFAYTIPGSRVNAFDVQQGDSPYIRNFTDDYARGELPSTWFDDYAQFQGDATTPANPNLADPGLPTDNPYPVTIQPYTCTSNPQQP